MYAIYGSIYHQYTPNVSIYTIHGSYGLWTCFFYLFGQKNGIWQCTQSEVTEPSWQKHIFRRCWQMVDWRIIGQEISKTRTSRIIFQFYYVFLFFLVIEQLLTWTYRWPGPNADASSHEYLEFAAHAIAYPLVCARYGIDNVSGAFPGNKTGCDAHQIGPGDKETAQDWHGDFRDATWFNRVW